MGTFPQFLSMDWRRMGSIEIPENIPVGDPVQWWILIGFVEQQHFIQYGNNWSELERLCLAPMGQ